MPDHPGGLRPPPLLKGGGESNPGGLRPPPLLKRGGESNVAVILFPSSLEEGRPRSGRGGRASQVKMDA